MASQAVSDAFGEALRSRGVEERFWPLLAELCSDQVDYLQDISPEDLQGRHDTEGALLTPPVAKGLVRKLQQPSQKPADPPAAESKAIHVPALMRNASNETRSADVQACAVSLTRCAEACAAADTRLIRCALQGQLPQGGPGRRKVLAVILDRSGSMAGAMWKRVVSAVTEVVTDDLLQDKSVSIALVVFSDQATEVRLPGRACELQDLLVSREYSPQGGTSFKAAFTLAEKVVRRELAKHMSTGLSARDVDLAALVFTDGEDTSVKGRQDGNGIRLVDKDASLAAARAAGDAFRAALRGTGCATHLCVAAFGADHDPDQCQYLSDRYFYINRSEALVEVLAGGLGALLSSAGQCSLRLNLPPGLALEEPLPASLPLDSAGRLDHHVWLRAEEGFAQIAGSAVLHVDVEVAGAPALSGSASAGHAENVDAASFEGHLFLVDLVALRLRRIARELCGRRPSVAELTALRDRLTEAKDCVLSTRVAASTTRGHLRGRGALRERLAEIDAARERLSYALGQFDDRDTNDARQIGSVAIDAILRDAGQHVPQGPAAADLARRAAEVAALPPMEPLSEYGASYTTDGYSCCDAHELASQGDVQFFYLAGVCPCPSGSGFLAVEDAVGIASFESFQLLSHDGRQPVKSAERDGGFTHLGVPLYVSEGHFMRAKPLLPTVLRRLSHGGQYKRGASERQLLSLLGRSLVTGPAKSEAQLVALLHKARGVRAVLAAAPGEPSLLEECVAEAAAFREDAGARAECRDLYAVAGAGLLAEGWGAAELEGLAEAVVHESLRRRISHALRGAGEAKHCFMWSLLGQASEDDSWLDCSLPRADAGELLLGGAGFNPFRAPDELEALEAEMPNQFAPRPAGVASMLAILSSKRSSTDNGPQPSEWAVLRQQFVAWGCATEAMGGVGRLWSTLDALMTKEDACHLEAVRSCVANLSVATPSSSLREAFPDPAAIVNIAASVCLSGKGELVSLRTTVASALRTVVETRKALVCKYPITGSSFPKLDVHSKETVGEVWGAPAYPVDPELHHKAMLRVWRRTMRARITSTVKEALADKEYRKRGGKFVFPSPMDTFVRGLHRRTSDLHEDWTQRLKRPTSGPEARAEAVEEMLLRLRWDDSDKIARARLSKIVARIWDDLEGLDLSAAQPIPSALWLSAEDASADVEPAASASSAAEKTVQKEPPLESPKADEPAPAKGWLEVPIHEPCQVVAPPGLETPATEPEVEEIEPAGRYPVGAEAARAAMDAGLQETLDGLEAELRRRMETFAEVATPGSRVKLPLGLTAKQRKAVHLWAEMHGLEHRSFGYRGRRRLHLSVPGGEPTEEGHAEEFDWEAWREDGGSDVDGAEEDQVW